MHAQKTFFACCKLSGQLLTWSDMFFRKRPSHRYGFHEFHLVEGSMSLIASSHFLVSVLFGARRINGPNNSVPWVSKGNQTKKKIGIRTRSILETTGSLFFGPL